jgi:hypothetical protein
MSIKPQAQLPAPPDAPQNDNEQHVMWYDQIDTSPFGLVQAAVQAPDLTQSMLGMMDAIGTASVMQQQLTDGN